MLRRRVTSLVRPLKSSRLVAAVGRRYISKEPEKVFTNLADVNDPKRDNFFKYTWGTWLTNDKLEKDKRMTKFSLNGLNNVLDDIYVQATANTKKNFTGKDNEERTITSPEVNKNRTISLSNNIDVSKLGSLNPNEKAVTIKTIASIHEGKHHRIYKVQTNLSNEKSFVLRVPYALDDDKATIAHRIRSEVATLDFLDLQLNIDVPKVICFAPDDGNPLGVPFILQEYIEGSLLMKDWNPLLDDKTLKIENAEGTTENPELESLNKVIKVVADFHKKINSVSFNGAGSLYFKNDEALKNEKTIEDISNDISAKLKDRWVLGPAVERILWKKKNNLDLSDGLALLGPWETNSESSVTSQILKDTAALELKNSQKRLELLTSSGKADTSKENDLKEQITTYENVKKVAPILISSKMKALPNIKDLLKPTLFHPDLDPMNILMCTKENKPYLLDLEGTVIKPFILQSSPQFVAYDGPKIYNLKNDIPDFEKLSEEEQKHYEFMYKRTRNQFLWEKAMNERLPELIMTVAPPVKVLRRPYTAILEQKSDKDYILIDDSLFQLREAWSFFYKNGLVTEEHFPLEFTDEQVSKHADDLNSLHEKLVSSPFAATQGWVPQDMFENLLKAGILVKEANGNYTVKDLTQ
ncbi:Altered inheritance of mitochondria protein 9, mitochondrial [Nakaseomyces bracarensis]|uniref:Altered inheritance of mitochondria protein 9, mitochondrial n=1 Tax=Nakaseomyces bracarensis TaxID=273131 RepID=A0ABR4NW06_9SACH